MTPSINPESKGTSNWPGSEKEVIDPLRPKSERAKLPGHTSSAQTLSALARSPFMWLMLLAIAGSIAAFAILWIKEAQHSPIGPKDPLSEPRSESR